MAVVLMWTLAGCAGDDGSACPATAACSSHDTCGPAEVCIATASGCAKACQAAFPRKVTLTLAKATDFSGFGDDGKPWDSDGQPDPYARLEVESLGKAAEVVCETATVQDTDTPQWNKPCTVSLDSTSKLTFSVWDEDGAQDTRMLQATVGADAVLMAMRSSDGVGTAQETSRLWYSVSF
jgi:hypothetical protein